MSITMDAAVDIALKILILFGAVCSVFASILLILLIRVVRKFGSLIKEINDIVRNFELLVTSPFHFFLDLLKK